MARGEEPYIPAGFRDLVNASMRKRGLSIRQVALRADMSPSYLFRILAGERNLPSNEAILKLAVALGIHPPVLLLVEAERIAPRTMGELTADEFDLVMTRVQALMGKHRHTRARRAK